jgi:hypothetical protein
LLLLRSVLTRSYPHRPLPHPGTPHPRPPQSDSARIQLAMYYSRTRAEEEQLKYSSSSYPLASRSGLNGQPFPHNAVVTPMQDSLAGEKVNPDAASVPQWRAARGSAVEPVAMGDAQEVPEVNRLPMLSGAAQPGRSLLMLPAQDENHSPLPTTTTPAPSSRSPPGQIFRGKGVTAPTGDSGLKSRLATLEEKYAILKQERDMVLIATSRTFTRTPICHMATSRTFAHHANLLWLCCE